MAFMFAAALIAAQVTVPLSTAYDYPDPASPMASAVEKRFTGQFNQCVRKPELDPLAKGNCQSQEYLRQDRALNFAYRQAMQKLKPDQRLALRDAERTWIKRVSVYCDQPDFQTADGTDSGCMISETIRRTIWLEKLR